MRKKKIYATIVLVIALALPVRSQVFMIDGDDNYRAPQDPEVFASLPADYGYGVDYYTPLGDGMLLLMGLGGMYLFGKRKSEKVTA